MQGKRDSNLVPASDMREMELGLSTRKLGWWAKLGGLMFFKLR